MPAESNIAGMARLLYLLAGAAVVSWGLWGADQGWTQWSWLVLGGVLLVLAIDRLFSSACPDGAKRIRKQSE